MEDLMKRVQRLEDIEAIKSLQAKYWRCLDTKEWDEMGECFPPKFHTFLNNGRVVYDHYEGDDGLRKYYEDNMPAEAMISQHNGHTPEIVVAEDGKTAHAKWYLHDFLIIHPTNYNVRGTAIYDIDYGKFDGVWLITDIGYQRIYEENWFRNKETMRYFITENRFSGKPGKSITTLAANKAMK